MTAVLREDTEKPAKTTPPKPGITELLVELEELGEPNLIAEYFEDEGIIATPCNAGICALAIYLQRYSGRDEINVGTSEAMVWHGAEMPDERWDLGPVVREFVAEFDAGTYPELLWPELRKQYAPEVDPA